MTRESELRDIGGRHITRKIATDSFHYGNHRIVVEITLSHTNKYTNLDYHDVMNGVSGFHYYRIVSVGAIHDGSTEVKNTSSVALDQEKSEVNIPFLGSFTFGRGVPDIPEHVEYTVRPVLEELDELYKYTTEDVHVDVEVALDRMEHEMSWVDVDDEVERIGKEIDSMVGDSDA